MEVQGIITGIGLPRKTLPKIDVAELPNEGQANTEYWLNEDGNYSVYVYKDNDWVLIATPTNVEGVNVIKPEIDAVINDFIIGYNTILNGLTIEGNTLKAGTCVLLGYRGILENDVSTLDGNYIYGKFDINFDEEVLDSFSISISNNVYTAPNSINKDDVDHTYYLPLYHKVENQWQLMVDKYGHPYEADTADNADHLLANGTIDSTATTETAPLGNYSGRVANTEFVKNKIEEQIGYATTTITVSTTSGTPASGSLTLLRKAKYVFAKLTMPNATGGQNDNTFITFTLPDGYKPKNDVYFTVIGTNKIINISTASALMYKISAGGSTPTVYGNVGITLDSANVGGGYTFNIGWETF